MMIESTAAYRESLRAFKPRVFVNGALVPSVADEPLLQPGINAIGTRVLPPPPGPGPPS